MLRDPCRSTGLLLVNKYKKKIGNEKHTCTVDCSSSCTLRMENRECTGQYDKKNSCSKKKLINF